MGEPPVDRVAEAGGGYGSGGRFGLTTVRSTAKASLTGLGYSIRYWFRVDIQSVVEGMNDGYRR